MEDTPRYISLSQSCYCIQELNVMSESRKYYWPVFITLASLEMG